MAYKRLIDEFHLKQDEIAERVGKSRTAVTNAMRLLKLSEKVQQMLIDEMITAGHARAILAISDKEKQESVAMKVFRREIKRSRDRSTCQTYAGATENREKE